MKNFINSDIAVSESISFALTLAIIILASAMVYFAGVPIMEKSQRTTHFQEMEKSFIFVLQNIDKVGYDRAPLRNIELKMKGGRFTVSHDSVITVGGFPYDLGSIEYYYDEKTVAYENGAIWTKYPNGEVIMFSNPTFSIGNVTTIPAFQLLGQYEIGGEGNVRIKSIHQSSSVWNVSPENGNVSLVINSSYYKGWEEYLKNSGANDVYSDDFSKSVTANITASVLNVDSNQIKIQIE